MKLSSSVLTALVFGFSIFGFVAAGGPCYKDSEGVCHPVVDESKISTDGTIGIVNGPWPMSADSCTESKQTECMCQNPPNC